MTKQKTDETKRENTERANLRQSQMDRHLDSQQNKRRTNYQPIPVQEDRQKRAIFAEKKKGGTEKLTPSHQHPKPRKKTQNLMTPMYESS